eukprot:456977-Pelagomonas_calceolata.AAC.1
MAPRVTCFKNSKCAVTVIQHDKHLASNTCKQKFPSLPPDTHSCSHKCPQGREAFTPAKYRKIFTPKSRVGWK